MKGLKTVGLLLALSSLTANTYAGGLLTNTNQSIAFCRNFARDGVIAIDGVYSNPAGVAFLSKGWHLSFNVQNVYQTRTIESGLTLPALEGTSYYQPFKLNGGDAEGKKTFKGKASVPVLPSIQAALNYDRWGFQAGFGLIGGGGKCTFNNGLASFEREVSLIPMMLNSMGLTTDQPSYGVDSYINGKQYVFGFQFGATYKINEHMAVYGGFRFNYIWNQYEGNITNLTANIGGENVKLYDYFDTQANTYDNMAFYYTMRASEMESDPATQKVFQEKAAQCQQASEKMGQAKELVADRYLDCTQNGWGITPIIGFDYRIGNLNLGTRLEFTNHLNIENDTKRDDTGLFGDGVNTPNDLPGLLAIGAQHSIRPNLRVMAGWHYYFDKDAEMADGKQKKLSRNTQEYLAGVEWEITKNILVSCGGQRTSYGLGDGGYLSDMSFVTSSWSMGFGAKIRISKRASVNIAYFWTNYEHFNKQYETTQTVAGQELNMQCTDNFTRTNKVLGAGIDIDI